MPIFLAAIHSMLGPYWDSIKKRLRQDDAAPLTIIDSPNLVGHPIGIAVLLLLGIFMIPSSPWFFFFWWLMILISSFANILTISGLIKTEFLAVEVIGSLSFVINSVFAVILLRENLTILQAGAIAIAAIGVLFFVWPKRDGKKVHFDRGAFFVLLAVILGGFSSICYKLATFHADSYGSFLSGRFIGDLIGWNTAWLISLFFLKRKPLPELKKVYQKSYGLVMVGGITITSLASSWVIYKLPVVNTAILSTLCFPVSYLISRFKYHEKITSRMWIGTLCIFISLLLFFLKIG